MYLNLNVDASINVKNQEGLYENHRYSEYLNYSTVPDCEVPVTLYTSITNDVISEFDISTYENAVFSINERYVNGEPYLTSRNKLLFDYLINCGFLSEDHPYQSDGVKIIGYSSNTEKEKALLNGDVDVIIDASSALIPQTRALTKVGTIASYSA